MEATETKVIGKYKISIYPDEDPQNPREWDNLGTMVCFSRRHSLGDKHNFDFEEAKQFMRSKNIIVLPLYLLDHSGITMNTTGFSCPWDSGQVGWIYIEKSKVRSEYGWKRITKDREKKIREYLRSEVEEYDKYISGDCYGYKITLVDRDDPDEELEEVDSCWGFFGEECCMKEAESVVQAIIKKEQEMITESV
jgi:hypothetical protein